jgi:hypothetical protein
MKLVKERPLDIDFDLHARAFTDQQFDMYIVSEDPEDPQATTDCSAVMLKSVTHTLSTIFSHLFGMRYYKQHFDSLLFILCTLYYLFCIL